MRYDSDFQNFRVIEHTICGEGPLVTDRTLGAFLNDGYQVVDLQHTDKIVTTQPGALGSISDGVKTVVRVLVYVLAKRRDDEIETLRDWKQAAERDYLRLNTEHECLRGELKKADEKIADLQQQFGDVSAEVDVWQSKLDHSEERRNKMEQDIARARAHFGDKAWKEATNG